MIYTESVANAIGVLDYQHIRGFPKVDHSGRSARIVLEQINLAKKNYL